MTEFGWHSESTSPARRRIEEAGRRYQMQHGAAAIALRERFRRELAADIAKAERQIVTLRRKRLLDMWEARLRILISHHASMDAIASEVALRTGVAVWEMQGPRRDAWITKARHEAMSRCRHEAHCSLTIIGRYFNRDHTTVLHAIRKHAARLKNIAEAAI